MSFVFLCFFVQFIHCVPLARVSLSFAGVAGALSAAATAAADDGEVGGLSTELGRWSVEPEVDGR